MEAGSARGCNLINKEVNDKDWWFRWCQKHSHDPVAQARARELWPSLFYSDGKLCPVDQIDFEVWDRQVVPARESPAYKAAGIDKLDLSFVGMR